MPLIANILIEFIEFDQVPYSLRGYIDATTFWRPGSNEKLGDPFTPVSQYHGRYVTVGTLGRRLSREPAISPRLDDLLPRRSSMDLPG